MNTLSPVRDIAQEPLEAKAHPHPILRSRSQPRSGDPVLRFAGAGLAVVMCACHAFTNRHLINPDGISYLDVAGAYLAGDWIGVVNSYWSPLYSWLLAGAFALFRPTPYWECAVAHGLNFSSFLLALVAFEGMLSELLRWRDEDRETLRPTWHDVLPDWLLVGLSYTLFIVVARRLVSVSAVTPDMLVLAGVLAASLLLLRLRRTGSPRPAALLGLVLGLSFLAKAVMFPLALVYLAMAMWFAREQRKNVRAAVTLGTLSVLTFAVVAGPWVAVLSMKHGKFTFGESGCLNYLWYVNGLPHPNQLARRDVPLTPRDPKALSREPFMTLSEAKGAESCPLWYDPTRFYEGVAPRFDLVQQVVASGKVSGTYFLLFAERLVAWTLSIVALLGFGYFSWRGDTKSWLINWLGACRRYLPLLLPALTGFGLYLVVGHAEGRLVGPFVVLLGVGLLATIRLPHPRQATGRPFGVATLACLVAILGGYAMFDVANAWSAFRAGEGKEAHLHYHVARQLQDLGLEPGEKVASIGFTYNAYWARLGGFGVLAEMPMKEASRFWASSPSEKTRVLNACRLAGARAVVCDSTPQGATGWRPVPGTTYAVRLLLEDEIVTRDVAGAD